MPMTPTMSPIVPDPAGRPVDIVSVPPGPAVLRRILPAVATALAGGPALMPLPRGPQVLRDNLVAALQPNLPVDVDDVVDGRSDPVALIVPTSGATGEPKGVLLGATTLRSSAEATHARLGGPGRWLLSLPTTHVAGLMILVRSVVAGTDPEAVDLSGGFDPETFAAASMRVLVDGGRCYTALVPTQVGRILDAGGAPVGALSAFDAVLVGGSPAPPGLLDRARSAGVRVVTTYGSTETCGGCVYDGLPLDGVSARIADDGRIQLSGPVLARGYRLRPDVTAEAFVDGWFTTGDLGEISPEGQVRVVGRVDDVALSGGVKVPLAAVDAAVERHSSVAAALAVALPDPEWGQRVVTLIVPHDTSTPPTLASVRACVARYAPAAYAPREIVAVESLPRLPTGKPDRRAATALAAERVVR